MDNAPPSRNKQAGSDGTRTALDWVAETVGYDALLQELQARARRRRRRAGMAGGLAALMLGGFVALRSVNREPAAGISAVHLQVSRPEQQVLPDGSLVELREGSRIKVDFSGEQRRVTLLHGEAHFDVKKDPDRPFVVLAVGVEVRAVGTAFAVQLDPRGVEVLVTHGRVAVEHAVEGALTLPSVATPLAFVSAGEGTFVTPLTARETSVPAPQVTAWNEMEMTERLSWRVPRLELSGTPLEAAVEAFNRHSRMKLVIGDPALARLKVSGIVRADQADALVSLLAANFDVTAEVRGGQIVLLSREAPKVR